MQDSDPLANPGTEKTVQALHDTPFASIREGRFETDADGALIVWD